MTTSQLTRLSQLSLMAILHKDKEEQEDGKEDSNDYEGLGSKI